MKRQLSGRWPAGRMFVMLGMLWLMAIKVKFFASLREQQQESRDAVNSDGVHTIADVWSAATNHAAMPDHVLCSVNLEHCESHDPVKDGDEVAFFPPVTGG